MSPKVLIICPRLDVGGTERHLVRILIALRRVGIDASLFVLSRGGRLESELISAGVPVYGPYTAQSRLNRAICGGWALFRHLRYDPCDIVHFFLPEAYLIGRIAAAAAGIHTRIMSRRSLNEYQQDHPLLARLEILLHGKTQALLGNSAAVVTQLVNECGNHDKVGLIYNGIEIGPPVTAEARANIRNKLGISQDSLALIVVANLIAYKGYDDLFDAIGMIGSQLPRPWRLMLIGRDCGMIGMLKEKAQKLGFAGNVMWLGERMDVDRLLGAADISVLSSHQEGFSNSLIEAMGAGLPVIATSVGGNMDAVVHGKTGLLVEVRSPKALSSAILALATDPDRRRSLGQAARRRVEELFSLDACVDRYVNLYRGSARLGTMPVANIIAGEPGSVA